uniref:S1 motif domain-containing protein n=1 Tax=Physcomitrium patens TaxID=3218 RepID=A0A2K1IZ82_PHYPA|nr:hypothetical protein PHYPA_024403 [Physcomitrium patens]
MSARVCSQQLQGLTLCLRGESECVRTLQARGKSLFLEGSGRFACGKLIVSKTRVRSRSTRSPLWCAEYTDSRDPPHDVRSCELDLVSVGGEDTDPSSEHVPQSIDAEECNNEHISVNGNTAVAGDGQSTGCANNQYGQLHMQDLLPLDQLPIDQNKWILADDTKKGDEAGEGNERGGLGTPPRGLPYVIHDEEVYAYESPAPHCVDIGTVLEMEVVGKTMTGKPLLSARKAAQRVAWDRVLQIKDEHESIEVEIVDYGKAGVIARVEGLRAFLPLTEFVIPPDTSKGESHKDYVGRKLWVCISFAREIRGNIVISEKDAWIQRNLKLGSLHDGTVTKIVNYGAYVQINRTNIGGIIHISNMSTARINRVSNVLKVGDQVKMIAVECPTPGKLSFSTALLEFEPGLMLRDKERVFREAEQTATTLRKEHSEGKHPSKNIAERSTYWKTSKSISNLEWLDFRNGESYSNLLLGRLRNECFPM